jgi:hypothetical protein
MSESWKDVLDALSDEEERMAVLIAVVRFETRKEKILELLRHNIDLSMKARLTRDQAGSCIQKRRRYQEQAPVLKLHYDVLSEIAIVFSRVQENGAWPFSGVCRSWRETVLSTPRAWTNIHLKPKRGSSSRTRSRYSDLHPAWVVQTPDPALCIERAGALHFHLELHELITSTPNLSKFLLHIMPHVQHLYIHESAGSALRVSQPAPKLKELLIIRIPRTTDISDEDFKTSSFFLFNLLRLTGPNEWVVTLSRLQVARFHELNMRRLHIAAFKQLRALTLCDCKCEAASHLHELLQTNCKTLEHLHLSVYPSAISESQEFQPILLPKLRTLSFLVAREMPNIHRSYQNPIFSILYHAISLFQSLLIPEVTELQVFAPCIQNLDLRTHFPSLQHLYFIIPETIDEISPYIQSVRSLLITAPLQTIDLFIAPRLDRSPEAKYNMVVALKAFLHDHLVLGHHLLIGFTLKSTLDFEPLRERVRGAWKGAGKGLHISRATSQECRSNGFRILEDVVPQNGLAFC